jgi:hypothetical protein
LFLFDGTYGSSIAYIINNGTSNREMKIPTASLTNVFATNNTNKGKITGVKFTLITSSGTATFYCSGIRCISSTWKYAPVDINTLENSAVKPVPPTGFIPKTTLNGAINNSTTTIVLSDSTNFLNTGLILIESELISYTGITRATHTLTGVIRGVQNTIKVSHSTASVVTAYNYDFSINTDVGGLPTLNWPATFRGYNSNALISNSNLEFIDGTVHSVINLGQFIGESADESSNTNRNNFTFYFRNNGQYFNQTKLNELNQSDLNGNTLITTSDSNASLMQSDLSIIPGTFSGSTLPSPLSGSYQSDPNGIGHADGVVQSVLSVIPGKESSSTGTFGQFASVLASLNSSISDSQTSSIAVSNSGSLNSGGGTLLLEEEKITYTSISSGILQGVVRGTNGTTASAHRSNTFVLQASNTNGYQIGYDNPEYSGITVPGYKQSDFVKTLDPDEVSFLSSSLNWYKDDTNIVFKITIGDSLSSLFTFSFSRTKSYWQGKTIAFTTKLVDNKIQCKIFEVTNNGELNLIYDTKQIYSHLFKRVSGHFGWTADLKDGGSRIQSIRSGGVTYAEYKSVVMKSFTPVRGAQIFANQTQDKELVTLVGKNKWSASDNITSAQDTSVRNKPVTIYTITNLNKGIWQGLTTNNFKIENFEDIYIKFDLKSYSLDTNVECFLYNETINKLFKLNMPLYTEDQWNSIKIIVSNDKLLPGNYKLVIAQGNMNSNTDWQIKNVSIKQRGINWDLRSFANTSWQDDSSDWIKNYFAATVPSNDFTQSTNKNDGVVFGKIGPELQIRAQAINPYVEITNFEVHPSYATLGNFVWSD